MRSRLSLVILMSFFLYSTVMADITIQPSPLWNAVDNPSLGIYAADDNFGVWDNQKSISDTTSNNYQAANKKSTLKAGILSALIPGAGEFYLGKKKKARYFFATEVVTWLGYISLQTYAGWKEDDLIAFAAVHANAQLEGKDEEFIDHVGFYESIDEFNIQGRIIAPERPYLPDTEENHWAWDSQESQDTFKEIKSSGRDAERRANFMIGLAVVSRVLSVIDAVRDGHKINKTVGGFRSDSERNSLELTINPHQKRNQVQLTLHTGF